MPSSQAWRSLVGMLASVGVVMMLVSWNLTNVGMAAPTISKNSTKLHLQKEIPWNQTFAACLLWKDDNHHLIEWLAYHYQRLPLRRLIIGVDPTARTNMSAIARRYNSRGLMNITVWENDTFMDESILSWFRNRDLNASGYYKWHLDRQKEMYRSCLVQLLSENATWRWVAFFDVDEFIAPNHYVHPGIAALHPPIESTNWNLFEWLETAAAMNSTPEKSRYRKPCFAAPRITYGSNEDVDQRPTSEVNLLASSTHFNLHDFVTYRWKYSYGPNDDSPLHKGILNLQRVRQVMPAILIYLSNAKKSPSHIHRPITKLCDVSEIYEPNPAFIFRLNHYIGSREQYFFRRDYRADIGSFRTDGHFEDKMKLSTHLDPAFPMHWLDHFVDNVGLSTAQALLEGVGQLEHPSHCNRRR